MFDRGSPWDGQHDRRSPQQPRECDLCGARIVSFCNPVQNFSRNFTGSEWEPGNEGDPVSLAIFDHVVPFTVCKAVAVLDGDDRSDFASALDVLLCDVGQSDQANLALVAELSLGFNRNIESHDRLGDAMLVNIDSF